VRAARGAFESWASTPLAERVAFLRQIQAGLEARLDEIATLISMEVGTPIKMAQRIQAGLPVAEIGSFIEAALQLPLEETVGNSTICREPKGVVACITPWNYPLHQIVSKVAPALLAGCTVVLKPSEVAPLNAFILADIIAAAGLPAGVFQPGDRLWRHGRGSPGVPSRRGHGLLHRVDGRRQEGGDAGRSGCQRVALELGGKSASIILDDADLIKAVKSTVNSCFLNSGQTCNALTRLLVPEERYEEISRLVLEATRAFHRRRPRSTRKQAWPAGQRRAAGQGQEAHSQWGRGRGRTSDRRGGRAGRVCHGLLRERRSSERSRRNMQIAQTGDLRPRPLHHDLPGCEEAVELANGTIYGLGRGRCGPMIACVPAIWPAS